MNYQESLQFLYSLGHELRGVKFRLETIRSILGQLGDPHLKYRTAIIAGTNGKGSTAAFLASIVQQAGYRTGLYTSPHLLRVNERFQLERRDISDEDFANSFTAVHEATGDLRRRGTIESVPSFFEFITATAFVHFAGAGAEFVVLEVGMGGRLDATNVTEPRVAIITNVDLDHQEFLGSTHAEIAREKAGVIRPSRPVISACAHPDATEVIRRRAAEIGATLVEIPDFGKISNLENREGRYSFDFNLGSESLSGISLPLAGSFQVQNAAAAVAAAWELRKDGMDRITPSTILGGLRCARWPGRLEKVCGAPLFLVDGAHNPAAAREVAKFVQENLRGRKLRLIYASMGDKAVGEISEILWPLAAEVILTKPGQPRAASPEDILSLARISPSALTMETNVAHAVEHAIAVSSPEDVILAAGSLFLVGEIKKALLEKSLHRNPEAAREAVART